MIFTAKNTTTLYISNLLLLLTALTGSLTSLAQPAPPKEELTLAPRSDTTANKAEKFEKKLTVSGMTIVRYTYSPNKSIDINGQHHTGTTGYSSNGFTVRRVRVGAKSVITPRTEVAVLLNATDFIGSPQNKVLENAYVKYRFNDYLNVQLGQYRPFFGKEDLYPEEQLETLEWSNGYYAFGANGWQSFQEGATFFGKVNMGKVPLAYYIGVFNGNGRNQTMDNNNSKLFPVRLEAALRPQTKLGLNAGWGNEGKQRTWAAGADIEHRVTLAPRLSLHLQAEYKTGFNSSLFLGDTASAKISRDYRISGFYALPFLAYAINKGGVQAAGLSMRWETLDASNCSSNNRKNTCCPMVCVLLNDPCTLRFEVGAIINDNEFNVLNTTAYDHTRFVCQVKTAF